MFILLKVPKFHTTEQDNSYAIFTHEVIKERQLATMIKRKGREKSTTKQK